jgi:succinate dehydrogenase/fumarate reductase flavoprotein subunit
MTDHITKKQYGLSCDVLIIGGGSAGLRAAIEAHDTGANVLVVSKNKSGDPHTTLARGGINAALGTMDPQDNWIIRAADTLREGEFLADYERVEVLCKNAPDAINELVNWGDKFHREKDGRLTQRFFGAHYRSDFPKIDDQSWQVNIYCRKEGKGVSGAAAKMVLLKHNVKEIKGPLADFLKSHIKAAHHRTFE